MALDKSSGGGEPPEWVKDIVAAAEAGAGQQQSISGLQGNVYMGTKKQQVRARGYGDHTRTVRVPNTMSANDAYMQFFQWNDKKRKDFIAQGILGGLLNEGAGMMEASKVWKAMVGEAAMYNAAGTQISPWDIMSGYVKQSGGAGAWVRQGDFEINSVTGERRYVGPQFKTTTDTRVDLTDPRTAQAIATQVFQRAMGRNPKQGELERFAAALAKAEKANPITSVVTTEFDTTTGEAIGQNTVTSGGMTAEARAMIGENQAKKDPEYGAFQAATTYQGALEALVFGSPEL